MNSEKLITEECGGLVLVFANVSCFVPHGGLLLMFPCFASAYLVRSSHRHCCRQTLL